MNFKSILMIAAVAVGLLASNAVRADTFYLHADKTYSQSDTDKTIWWDAPSGGNNMSSGFAGNTFVLNNFNYQTETTSGGTRSFDGTMVLDSETITIYSGGFNLGGLDWSDVEPLIKQQLGDVEAEIYLYSKYVPGKQAVESGS